jgi:lipopolysaccharide export system permease protein
LLDFALWYLPVRSQFKTKHEPVDPVLFQTTIRRELGKNYAATLVVLSIIVLTMALLRVLNQATRGLVNPTDVLTLMAYTMLGNFPTLLALALLIAIVHTLSRMAADNEMVIWHSSGKGLAAMIGPVLRFSWPVIVAVCALSLVVWPWANAQSQLLRDRYEQRGDMDRLTPGQFQESANGRRVFFVDVDNEVNLTRKNLFVYDSVTDDKVVITARSGTVNTVNERQYLVLEKGQRATLHNVDGSTDLIEFERLGHFVKQVVSNTSDDGPPKAKSTYRLLLDPTVPNLAELAWRLGLVIASVNFMLLAIALSAPATNRQRKFLHYVYALLIFVTYYNFINLGQNWIQSGRVPFSVWLGGLHGLVFLIAFLWLYGRHNAWQIPSIRLGRSVGTTSS